MEIKILEESKNKLIFQIIGADHTFCNALKRGLIEVKGVEIATYAIEHPQVGIPKMLIETKGAVSPKAALAKAAAVLLDANKEFLTAFEKATK